MIRYLFDTSIISLFAPDMPPVSGQLAKWILDQDASETLFLSVVAVAEIERGIQSLRRRGARARTQRLTAWLDDLLLTYADRVLPIDANVARIAGVIEDRVVARGKNPGLADILVAATAAAHDMIVLTANTRHFVPLGVPYENPLK